MRGNGVVRVIIRTTTADDAGTYVWNVHIRIRTAEDDARSREGVTEPFKQAYR